MSQRVLITGGAGFIGLNLLDYLLEHTDWLVAVLDNLEFGNQAILRRLLAQYPQRLSFLKGDIRDTQKALEASQGVQAVVHLAAQTGVVPSQENPFEDAQINVSGTLNLLEAARQNQVKRFIFASSAAPLGNQEMPLNEKKVPQPLSPYGASKLAGEAYCSAYAGSFNLKTAVLRFSNVYGPYSGVKGSVVPLFIKNILQGKPVTIYGDGQQTRDFVFAQDIARGIYLALTKDLPEQFNLFHLGSGQETSVNQLFERVKAIFKQRGYKVKAPHYQPARPGEIERSCVDITKAQLVLGFYLKVSLSDGLRRTIDWFVS